MSEIKIKTGTGWKIVDGKFITSITEQLPLIGNEGVLYLTPLQDSSLYQAHVYTIANGWVDFGGSESDPIVYEDIIDAIGYTPIDSAQKGVAGGLASLDESGKIPSSQLPSYVDDVLEYGSKQSFPATGENGKIYVDKANNVTYRWSGSEYVAIGSSLALGETSSTAYAGDKGKATTDTVNTHVNSTALHTSIAEKNKWDAKYDLPSTGIPKLDLSQEVRNSLGLADTAVQQESDPTVPDWAKQENKPSYTAEEVGALPDTTVIPTQVSDLENDANYISGESVITGHIVSFNPVTKTAEMTQAVGLDDVGKLWTTPGSIGEGYVTNTDYATKETGGVIKLDDSYGFALGTTGKALLAQQKTLAQYGSYSQYGVISKGTLENIKETLVKSVGDDVYQPIGDYALASDIPEVTQGEQGWGFVANVVRDAFDEAKWANYGTKDHEELWSATESIRNGCRVGDLFTISGTATDSGNGHIVIYISNTASGNLKGKCIGHVITKAGANYNLTEADKESIASKVAAYITDGTEVSY